MAGTSSGIVAGLTATVLGTVALLAWQAQATVPPGMGRAKASASPSPAAKAPRDSRHPTALPRNSGKGERVVYSVDDDRVWLVDDRGQVRRTFKVRPGQVDPRLGAYWVTSRSKQVTGTDGVLVEHVVRFATRNGVTIGFSAATEDEPGDTGSGSVKTGGIRETRADGNAMWQFATIGVPVMVIR
ncbi:hypothetical protein [Streptomyces sp. LaPpAH-108]|uniref:hypothetical protein n=1 Tax=Streptomyces sp. LaPpAH-108 TaxID=1155714 RepID=UPI000568AAE3|nr:hypothetical protein [Streptomyces sp. LaPpAH-108]